MRSRNPAVAAAALLLTVTPLEAAPLPDAVFQARADFEDLASFEQAAVFDAEGLFEYEFVSQAGPPYASFNGTIEVRGGDLLFTRVTGDFGPTAGQGSAYAHLEYAFRVAKTNLDAPDVPVPVLISAHAKGSLVRMYGANRMPRWQAGLGYRYGAASTEALMALPIEYTYDDSYSNEVAFDGVRSQLPGVEGRFYLTAIGEAYGTSTADWQGGTFDVTIDPYVRIDPAFTVEVGGTTRPGTEVYALEFSAGIGQGVPEPGALSASLVALGSLVLARRKARHLQLVSLRAAAAVVLACAPFAAYGEVVYYDLPNESVIGPLPPYTYVRLDLVPSWAPFDRPWELSISAETTLSTFAFDSQGTIAGTDGNRVLAVDIPICPEIPRNVGQTNAVALYENEEIGIHPIAGIDPLPGQNVRYWGAGGDLRKGPCAGLPASFRPCLTECSLSHPPRNAA